MSLSVIAGSSGRAYVTLMPLRGASGPGETRARDDLAVRRRCSTAKPRHAVADDDLASAR